MIEVPALDPPGSDIGRPPMVASLSPSSMATWRQCPKRFFFEKILRIETETGEPAVCGSFIHLVLQHLMDRPPPQRTAAVARGIATEMWLAFIADPDSRFGELELDVEQVRAFKHKAWTGISGYFRIEDPTSVEVDGTEQEIMAELDGAPVYGIIDRVDVGADGLVVTDYKGLALTTPLPTPTGWTTMGEVREGDLLLAADGRETCVIAKSETHHRPCYELELSGGSRIVCDAEHLWVVEMGSPGERIGKTVRADELAHLVATGECATIANAQPLAMEGAVVPFDAYALGLRLGTGSTSAAEHPAPVPAALLRAPCRQRMALLAGLMDGGGGWDAPRCLAMFSTADARVADAFAELVHSLGWTCSSVDDHGAGPCSGDAELRCTFSPTTNPFRLPSKRVLFAAPDRGDATRRTVIAVKPVRTVATACVLVDSSAHLYLAGRAMTPTHNSGKAPLWDDEREEKLGQLRTYAAMLEANGRPVSELRLLFVSPQLSAAAKAERCHAAVREAMAALAEAVAGHEAVVEAAVWEVERAHQVAREEAPDRHLAKIAGDEAIRNATRVVAQRISGAGVEIEDVATKLSAAVLARRRAFFAQRAADVSRPTTVSLRVREEDLEMARGEARSIWAEATACYEAWDFPGRTGALCGWCPFSDRCDSFAVWDAAGRPEPVRPVG